MPKYLGPRRIGYCQRTGFKVRYSDLVEDGEQTGVLVERGWDDPIHPQKFAVDTAEAPHPRPSSMTEPASTVVIGSLLPDSEQ